jgi:hypothetical protein
MGGTPAGPGLLNTYLHEHLLVWFVFKKKNCWYGSSEKPPSTNLEKRKEEGLLSLIYSTWMFIRGKIKIDSVLRHAQAHVDSVEVNDA